MKIPFEKIFWLCIILATWEFLLTPRVSAQGKIGYIDFQYLISQVKSADDVQLELQKRAAEWTTQLEAMKDSLANLEKDLETISITLTKPSRDILNRRIIEERRKIAAFQEQKFSPVNGDLYKKQQELLQPVIDKIKKAIDNIRLKEKYDVIFDISTGNPVSIDKKSDLTLLVIDELGAVGLTVKEQGQDLKNASSSKDVKKDDKKIVTPPKNTKEDPITPVKKDDQ